MITSNSCRLKGAALIAFTLILSTIASCKKTDSLDGKKDLPPQFLFAGYTYKGNHYNTANKNAILFINNSLINLSPNNRSDAQAVFGNGKDVFVAGFQHNGSENRRIVSWTNGSIKHLSEAHRYNQARAIYEDHGKVYVSGTAYREISGNMRPYQRLWVDGKVEVSQGALDLSGIEAITTYDGQYFLAGQFAQSASIWYNNTMQTIRNSPSNATYIRKTATDTIALGYGGLNRDSDVLMAWKNGENVFSHTLNERVTNALAYMDDHDYYFVTVPSISGGISPKVFKNSTLLHELAPGKTVIPVAIQVFRNKVYVLSNIIEGNKSTPTLWVDGEPQTLHPASKNIYLHQFYIAETEKD